jgi:hypothetical protein
MPWQLGNGTGCNNMVVAAGASPRSAAAPPLAAWQPSPEWRTLVAQRASASRSSRTEVKAPEHARTKRQATVELTSEHARPKRRHVVAFDLTADDSKDAE